MKKYVFLLLFFVLLIISSSPIYAKDYYVSKSQGNNSNPGTLSQPFKTIQRGVNKLKAGDRLFVRGGVYNEQVFIETASNGPQTIVQNYPGETPIIDANYSKPTGNVIFTDPKSGKTQDAFALVQISGNNILFKGFEVRESAGVGITVANYPDEPACFDNIVEDCYVHNVRGPAVLLFKATNCTIKSVRARLAGNFASYWKNRQVDWPVALVSNNSDGITFTNCTVSESWSEGIGMFNATNGLIDGNTVYDCMSGQVYLDNAFETIVRNNLIYHTGKSDFRGLDGGYPDGLNIADEPTFPSQGDGVSIYNNTIYGVKHCLNWRNFQAGSGLRNALIAYNTFVNPRFEPIVMDDGDHENVKFINNIIVQDKTNFDMIFIDNVNTSQFIFKNNLWRRNPGSPYSGTGDVVGNPQLKKTGSTASGQLTRAWFELKSNSPARNAGKKISQVSTDVYGTARGNNPDIGALEYFSATSRQVDYIAGEEVEIALNSPISFYPNPVKNELHLRGVDVEGAHLHIFDLMGKTVYKTNLTQQTLDMTSLFKGIYILSIRKDGKEVFKSKLLKE